MSNDFDEGFIDDDDDYFGNEEESASVEEGSSSGPFLIALAGFIGVFIIAAICVIAVVASRQTDNGQSNEVTAIETQNAVIQETNVAVTVAIQETEAAKVALAEAVQPTFTPETENTATPEAEATETPVVKQATATADAETGTGEASGEDGTTGNEESADGDKEGSSAGNGTIVGSGDAAVHTPTPTPISSTSGDGSGDKVLPDTGLEDWVFALMGLALIAVLFGARKLRTL